jgi:SAM-dependent methyltransferase
VGGDHDLELNALTSALPPLALYDARFFESLRDGIRKSAAVAVPLFIRLFQPGSVVDVGCGTGLWVQAFRERGFTDVLGIDGPWAANAYLDIPAALFQEHDLTEPLRLERKFDLALCLEVAEHLPTEAAQALVESLTKLAPIVVFSAAIPSQGGSGHINEQWPSVWTARFAECGYRGFTNLRHQLWSAEGVEVWYRQNMLCFVATNRIDVVTHLTAMEYESPSAPLDVVHPELFLRRARDLEQWERYAGRLEQNVHDAKEELARIKNSRAWRFYQTMRPALDAVRRARSSFRGRIS